MFSVFERRRGLNRSLSSMLIGDVVRDSPPISGFSTASRSAPRPIPRSVSCMDNWNAGGSEEAQNECTSTIEDCLEISELSCSPTVPGRIIWSFTPTNSPPTSHSQSPVAGFSALVQTMEQNSWKDHSGNDLRGRVISELIETEQNYIAQLDVLLDLFLPSLEAVVTERDIRLLLPDQLESLAEHHRDLLRKLEERATPGNPFHGIVGDLFGRLCAQNSSEFINMYSAYINEFKIAMRTLSRYQQNSQEFREALASIQRHPQCRGLNLSAYLLTPIQRLPRYELLLKELVKHTTLDHPDNYYLCEALDRLRVEMKRLNRSIQYCQLACSVARVKRKAHKRSKSQCGTSSSKNWSFQSRLRRHISTSNIDDYTPREVSLPIPISRPGSAMEQSLFRSTEYLGDESSLVEEEEEFTPMGSRAASCSDLLLDFHSIKTNGHQLSTLESLPSIPPSPYPSTVSESSVNPSLDDSCVRGRSQSSASSTASSTSGFGSLSHSQTDLSVTEGDKKMGSIATAFRALRRKSSSTPRPVPQLKPEISCPADFRHIQHGFVETFREPSPDSSIY